MNNTKLQWWERFQKHYTELSEAGPAVDLSRLNVSDEFSAGREAPAKRVLSDLGALEMAPFPILMKTAPG